MSPMLKWGIVLFGLGFLAWRFFFVPCFKGIAKRYLLAKQSLPLAIWHGVIKDKTEMSELAAVYYFWLLCTLLCFTTWLTGFVFLAIEGVRWLWSH